MANIQQQLRYYLNEDWEDEADLNYSVQGRKQAQQHKALTRRLMEKERGRGISKFQRDLRKQRQNGKP